jgi:DNA-binding MarR family transcriptional regulator
MHVDEIVISLRKVVRALNLESKRTQKEVGISIPQLLCLKYLNQAPDHKANTKELAKALNLNPSTISGIVSRLKRGGYIAHLPKRDDKRMTFITLTDEGAKLLQSAPPVFQQKLQERLSLMPTHEVVQLKRSLSLLTRVLDAEDFDASLLAGEGADDQVDPTEAPLL